MGSRAVAIRQLLRVLAECPRQGHMLMTEATSRPKHPDVVLEPVVQAG